MASVLVGLVRALGVRVFGNLGLPGFSNLVCLGLELRAKCKGFCVGSEGGRERERERGREIERLTRQTPRTHAREKSDKADTRYPKQ